MLARDLETLCEALRAKGLLASLDTPEAQANLHTSLAQANSILPEVAFEWLARQFKILPYGPSRPALSVQTESLFRLLAGQTDAAEPWLPVGPLGPLLIIGHYNPATLDAWGIPGAFCLKVLLSQSHYAEYRRQLDERLAARPLGSKSAPPPARDLERGGSPEAALRWLLSEYPFGVEEKERLTKALESLSGVAANHVVSVKALPAGFGAALRHLCTGEFVFNASLAPRQSAFPETLLEKHSVFPLFVGVRTVYLLSPQKEIFGFEDEWLSSNEDHREFRPVLADKESIVRVINRDRSNAAATGTETFVGELAESGAANVVEIDPQDIARVNPASINTAA